MTIPRVSVVMAAFNAAPFIREALESILRQSFTDFECIVVDDGSTDDTYAALAALARRDRRVILLRNRVNAGVVRALNRGLEWAQGEYIARQDADDVSLPERLARQVAFLDEHPDHGVIGSTVQFIDPGGVPLGIGYTASQNDEIHERLLDHMCLCGPSITIRRSSLMAAGYGFSEGLDASEDYDLCLRLAEVGRMASLEEPVYLYRQHPQSASQVKEAQQAFNKAVALERAIYRRFGPMPPADKFRNAARDFLRAAVSAYARSQYSLAETSLRRALGLQPSLLDSDEPLQALVSVYAPTGCIPAALAFTTSIFEELLPHTHYLARLESRMLSRVHMSEVFAGASQGQFWRARSHLVPGIRHDPTWLLNRGVISIAAKSILTPRVPAAQR